MKLSCFFPFQKIRKKNPFLDLVKQEKQLILVFVKNNNCLGNIT